MSQRSRRHRSKRARALSQSVSAYFGQGVLGQGVCVSVAHLSDTFWWKRNARRALACSNTHTHTQKHIPNIPRIARSRRVQCATYRQTHQDIINPYGYTLHTRSHTHKNTHTHSIQYSDEPNVEHKLNPHPYTRRRRRRRRRRHWLYTTALRLCCAMRKARDGAHS